MSETLDRLYFEIVNLPRYDGGRDGLMKDDAGCMLDRDEVLRLISNKIEAAAKPAPPVGQAGGGPKSILGSDGQTFLCAECKQPLRWTREELDQAEQRGKELLRELTEDPPADEFRPGQWQDVCRELGARMAKQERTTDEERALLDELCELHTLTRAVQSKQKQIVIPACVAVRLPIEGGVYPHYPAGAYERYREHWLRHETAKHVSASYFLDDSEILAAIDAAGSHLCAAKGTT